MTVEPIPYQALGHSLFCQQTLSWLQLAWQSACIDDDHWSNLLMSTGTPHPHTH